MVIMVSMKYKSDDYDAFISGVLTVSLPQMLIKYQNIKMVVMIYDVDL